MDGRGGGGGGGGQLRGGMHTGRGKGREKAGAARAYVHGKREECVGVRLGYLQWDAFQHHSISVHVRPAGGRGAGVFYT